MNSFEKQLEKIKSKVDFFDIRPRSSILETEPSLAISQYLMKISGESKWRIRNRMLNRDEAVQVLAAMLDGITAAYGSSNLVPSKNKIKIAETFILNFSEETIFYSPDDWIINRSEITKGSQSDGGINSGTFQSTLIIMSDAWLVCVNTQSED
jgi:hypothetical protein